MPDFDFTAQGRKPSTSQIISGWKKAGKPERFSVTYGETFAEFERVHGGPLHGWQDSGNGCRGVNRLAVVDALKKETDRGD
jgi:hypothetical protein